MNKVGDFISEIYSDKAAVYLGHITSYKVIMIFFIGCFLGYIIETLYCYPKVGFQSRQAVLYGPFVPVYGFGGVLLTLALYRLHHTGLLWLFLISALLGAAFEYFYSLLQELIIGSVNWDYSHAPFNLQGRTSLLYGLYWGVLGVLWIKVVFPFLSRALDRIPGSLRGPLTMIVVIFMVFNLILSSLAIKRAGERLKDVPADDAISRFLDTHYNDAYIAKVFPYIKYIR